MNDHETTPEELLECALIQQMESLKAYMAKYEKETSREKTQAPDGR